MRTKSRIDVPWPRTIFALSLFILFGGIATGQSTLTVGIGGIPISADPNVDTTILAQPIYNLMYDTLTAIDYESGQAKPALAESWELVSPTVWEFRLRPGLQFHNGEALDAAAVKFSFDRILDPENRSVRRGRISSVTSVEVVDELRVRVHTDGPSPLVPSQMVYVFILPPDYLGEGGVEQFIREPVGSGPYRVAEWAIGERVVFEAFDGNWQGVPPIERVEFRSIPEPFARVSAFEVGEVDVAYSLPPDEVQRLRNSGLQVVVQPLGGTQVIHFRQVLDHPVSDVRVRQAINYAVDKEAIISQVMSGVGSPADGQAVGADGFGYNPELSDYPYDPERAVQLLAEAGFPNGFELALATTAGRTLKDLEITQAVAGYLEGVGIRANIEVLENAVFVERFQGSHGPMFINTLYYAPLMDWDTFAFIFRSDNPRKNAANPEFDRLYDVQAGQLDPAERLETLREVQALFHEEAFVLFLFRVNEVYGVGEDVASLEFFPDYSLDIFNASLND